MDNVRDSVSPYFFWQDDGLRVGEVSIGKIIDQVGTPVFIYDQAVLEKKLDLLRKALPAGFDIYYSIKANPNDKILRHFVSKGCGLEVASAGEFYRARSAGCHPNRILFAGPGKTHSELDYTIRKGIGEIHLETFEEIDRVVSIASQHGKRLKVAIRINPGEGAQGGAMRMGGKPSPFGFDEERLEEVLDRICSEEALHFRGIHLFTGTQILDYSQLIQQYRKGLELSRRAVNKTKKPIEMLDFGGGLGIPYFQNEKELDIKKFGKDLAPMISEARRIPELSETTFVVEPGRYLVGEAGIYVTRVTSVKEYRGKKFLIVDGGMNHHLAASGNLGQVIKRNFPLALLNRIGSPSIEKVDVVGPLCTPLDILGREIQMPSVKVGDLIGVFQSGAYARSASPLGFLSHPTPPEVWVNGEEISTIRKRGRYEDSF